MPSLFKDPNFPLLIASNTAGYGTGWWLSEWLLQPGNDATDRIVFQAFALNLAALLWMRAKASGKAAGDA